MTIGINGKLDSTYYRRLDDYSVECAYCHSINFLPLKFDSLNFFCAGCKTELLFRDDDHPIFKGGKR